jgi:RND family efflux transporter MFP subunit
MTQKLILFAIAFIFISCGSDGNKSVDDIISKGDLIELREKKEELRLTQQEISKQSKLIDEAIAKLDTTKKLPLITTFTATSAPFKHYLEIQGSVQTKKNIVIYPEFSGVLLSVFVSEGEMVSKGQLLATIDDGGLSQQLAQLEVQETLAKTTFERQQNLWNQKIGSEIQYLQAKTNYEAQKNAVSQLQSQLAKTNIRAPFSGVIDEVITEQGTVVGAGQTPVIRLVNLDDMYIESDIPESFITNVTIGKEVQVYFPILGDTIYSKVRQVGSYINPNNRAFKIEVAVSNNNGHVKPNLTAKLMINDYTNEKAILIPQSIISENAEGQQYVYVTEIKDNNEAVAKKSIVETGRTQNDMVEIIDGLKDNDILVNEGARNVKDGQTVKILTIIENEE